MNDKIYLGVEFIIKCLADIDMEEEITTQQLHNTLQREFDTLQKLGSKDYHEYVWDDGKPLGLAYVIHRFNRFLNTAGMTHIRFHNLHHPDVKFSPKNIR